MFYFVYYSVGCGSNCCRWQHGNFRRHKVGGGYGTQGNGVIISAFVAHNAYAAHVGQRRKILAGALCQRQFVHFFAVNIIGILHNVNFFCRYFADNTDGKPRSRERWRVTRYSGSPSSLPDWRTSSLNKSRRGSTISLKSTKSGRPPTLWWLLMVADSPPRRFQQRPGKWCPVQIIDCADF